MTTKRRPLAAKSIAELEDLFTGSGSDETVRELLKAELIHRSTDRARRLGERLDTVTRPASEPIGTPERSAAATSRPPVQPVASPERPCTPDDPRSILSAWTALEALSPQTYRTPENCAGDDRSRVAFLGDGLPWTIGERSRPEKQLYYQLVLGSVRVDGAMQRLIGAFGTDEERRDRIREKAVLAAVLVDRQGCLLTDKSIGVSSFGWALPLALDLRLGELGDWPAVERRAIQKLDDMLRRVDEEGRPIPLDAERIDRAFQWLVDTFRLPRDLVEPPTFAVRIYHYYRSPNPPEVALLNSFFLNDLGRAKALDPSDVPYALRRYLGEPAPGRTFDLLIQRSALEAAVAPCLTPAARWPSPGGHPLVLLQQAAVNLARREPATGGSISVNGPPGTGKTTLLRDIVAGAVLDRALAMAAFEDPAAAMTPTGEKVRAGPNAFFHLYRLAPSLRGHEVLVASSNNKAVENVSRELPAATAIGRSMEECAYFQSISDHVHGPADGAAATVGGTWGMIAAVLGNAANRFQFGQRFWWDQDRGFRLYLKAAKGDSVVRETKDDDGRVIRRETPSVVLLERPPAPGTALRTWRRVRTRFDDLHREVTGELAELEAVRQVCLKLGAERRLLRDALGALPPLTLNHGAALKQSEMDRVTLADAKSVHDRRVAAVDDHRRGRPGVFARLFGTTRWHAWSAASLLLVADAVQAEAVVGAAKHTCANSADVLRKATESLSAARQAHDALAAQVSRLANVVDGHRGRLGDRIVDDAFFDRGHEASNLAAPWIPDSLHAKREALFLAALDLHRAFIDGAAGKVLHNLSILMDVMSKGPPKDPAKVALLGELWSTLFLVVPVLSTTFASVDAMFGDTGRDTFGWLLIDEAGQALPQAAVGAVMRATRTVVVGDPLQVPPVVSLPDRLTQDICSWFKVGADAWGAPHASAQTVADRASRFRGGFDGDRGRREVGVPLLVHRRCQEPMFGISNAIAYDNQMVHAVAAGTGGPVRDLLGPSTWFDVDGEAVTKWCAAEGERVVELFGKLAEGGVQRPDLFVVTPFRVVALEMRRRLDRESGLLHMLDLDRTWLKDRIGTVHTVQGREADTVIVVLGAPAAAHGGARSWAAGTPNILNVAVSRAKKNLYVVGSIGAWGGVGHAAELRRLPLTRGPPE